MYIGWCDRVQECDSNAARATHHTSRAETLAVWTGSRDVPQAWVAGLRMGAHWHNRNSIPPSRLHPKA